MKRKGILASVAILATLALASVGGAYVMIWVPDDGEPNFYISGGGPFILEDGTPWAMHDDEWAVIPFYRTPDHLAADFDLVNDSDPDWADAQLQIGGFAAYTDDGHPHHWQVRGLGAVPVVFVKWSELRAAMAEGHLYVGDLAACPSIKYGTASYYLEENHIYGVHPVSHLAVVMRGTLAGGGSFDVKVVEVGLELKQVQIKFKN
jgi:hypothetical protein